MNESPVIEFVEGIPDWDESTSVKHDWGFISESYISVVFYTAPAKQVYNFYVGCGYRLAKLRRGTPVGPLYE